MKRKWTERKYHVQDNAYLELKDVKMYCNTNVDKCYIYQLMFKVQLPGSVRFDSQIKMHTGTENKDVSLAKELKDHLEGGHRQNGDIDQGKQKKYSWKENGQKESIMFRIMHGWNSKMLKYIVTQINYQHYPSVVHIPNLMA